MTFTPEFEFVQFAALYVPRKTLKILWSLKLNFYAHINIFIVGIFFVLPCIESYQKVDLRTITLGVPPQEVCSSNPFKKALSHKKEWPLIKLIFANFNSHHNFLSTFGMYLFFHGKYCYNIHQPFSLFSQYLYSFLSI